LSRFVVRFQILERVADNIRRKWKELCSTQLDGEKHFESEVNVLNSSSRSLWLGRTLIKSIWDADGILLYFFPLSQINSIHPNFPEERAMVKS
jgi:hypothetical protein